MARDVHFQCVFVLCLLAEIVCGSHNHFLRSYEVLTADQFRQRIMKRDTGSAYPLEQKIEFFSFGRQFSLMLRKDFSILAPEFKLLEFAANGSSREVHLDFNIYRGSLEGERDSFITAYWNENKTLSASIVTPKETFAVEPALNLIPNSSLDSMIIYKKSDLKWDSNTSLCGYVDTRKKRDKVVHVGLNETLSQKISGHSRVKRQGCKSIKNSCSLYLAVHPNFFRDVGGSSVAETARFLLSIIDNIDQLYRKHEFVGCHAGFGFRVAKVHIFPQPTDGFTYTAQRNYFYGEILDLFSHDHSLSSVCLGHLFAFQTFRSKDGIVLGQAYVGSPDLRNSGGICSTGEDVFENSGYTSYFGQYRLPLLHSWLVTAHELGHNWGSGHDLVKDCIPSASQGGKYLMYPVAVSGLDTNNLNFSSCSLHNIGETLNAKSHLCFTEKIERFCGNYRVEDHEECDPGLNVAADRDPCCDSTCQLREGARCSDANHKCCKNCRIVKSTDQVQCFKTSPEFCSLDTYCNGIDFDCPESKLKKDGTDCINQGFCLRGACISECKVRGGTTCLCEEEKDRCRRCCIRGNGNCVPLISNILLDTYLPAGTACVEGICNEKGKCETNVMSPVRRLWSLLDISSPGAFVVFMRNNIVWAVVFLSLVLWIPVSCFVCHLDRKLLKTRQQLVFEVVDEIWEDANAAPPSKPSLEKAKGSRGELKHPLEASKTTPQSSATKA